MRLRATAMLAVALAAVSPGLPAAPQNFDVPGARAAGYSDAEISQYLKEKGFSDAQVKSMFVSAETHTPLAFWDCLLDKMPGTQNDVAAQAIFVACQEKYPTANGPQPTKPWRPLGYSSSAACAAEKSKETRSEAAAVAIYNACNHLY